MGFFSSWFKKDSSEQNYGGESVGTTAEPTPATEPETPVTTGPFDQADHPEIGDMLDCGALWIPKVPGMTLQFSMDRSKTTILGIQFVKDQRSALQLQPYAAPKSHGIWDQVRLDMMTSIANQGGSSREVEGPYGMELAAQMPVPNSEALAPHRYIGIEGPRWLLRATLYGLAGSDEVAAAEMFKVLNQVVVVRGNNPHPPRELLKLEIPTPVVEDLKAKQERA